MQTPGCAIWLRRLSLSACLPVSFAGMSGQVSVSVYLSKKYAKIHAAATNATNT